jgi:hypothetical protein
VAQWDIVAMPARKNYFPLTKIFYDGLNLMTDGTAWP